MAAPLRKTSRLILLWAVFGLMICSCVTNQKYLYLQKNDVNRQNMPKDSVFRTYSLEHFDYHVQPNDLISVRFESLTPEELNIFGQAANTSTGTNLALGGLLIGELVDDQGQITYPVVGKVVVGGLTVFEIQDKLQKLADQYLESPVVRVRLLNYRITILGEVNREGTVIFGSNRVNFLEAVGQAGGMTDLADKTSVKLIRQKGDKTEVVYLNFLDEDFMNSPYYYMYQNDVLIVPPLKQRPFRKYFGPNLALITSSLALLLLTLNFLKN